MADRKPHDGKRYRISDLARFALAVMGVSCAADSLWYAPKYRTKAKDRKKLLADFDKDHEEVRRRAPGIESQIVPPDGVQPRAWLMGLLMDLHDIRPMLAGCRVNPKYDELAFDQDGVFILSEHAESLRHRESFLRELRLLTPDFTEIKNGDEPAEQEKLTPAQRDIMEVVIEAAHRLTAALIADALARKSLGGSGGMLKQNLAELTRRKLLTNKKDKNPPGYGLPAWDREQS